MLSFVKDVLRVRCVETHFNPVGVCSTRKLQLVHSDMCGPMPVTSLGGHRYISCYINFIDDYYCYFAVYFMKIDQKYQLNLRSLRLQMIVTSRLLC